MRSGSTALVVVAHPDDETLGCGGTIARLVKLGVSVHVYALGDGVTSRGVPDTGDELAVRWDQFRRACEVLGARSNVEPAAQLYPDQRFDMLPLLTVVKRVEAILEDVAPETVLTHAACDLNVDHRTVRDAVLTAARPLPGRGVSEILAFEVPSSTEWPARGGFRPTLFVDITEALELKMLALARYHGEARAFPHPRSPEAVRALAAWRGATAGVKAAEAFEVVRILR